jgi:hypothetical protein
MAIGLKLLLLENTQHSVIVTKNALKSCHQLTKTLSLNNYLNQDLSAKIYQPIPILSIASIFLD